MENTFGKNIIPDNDRDRLAALNRYKILDTPPEDAFDRIAQLATKIFNTPVSLISLVDAERVFFKANIGAGDERETARGLSLCSLAVLSPEVLVFENAPEDPCVLTNPHIAAEHGLKFYAGAPLVTPDNFQIGTLCIVDFTARQFSEHERSILKDLSDMVMHEIELRLEATSQVEEYQTLMGEMSAANEELAAANEELIAVNESLTLAQQQLVGLNDELEEKVVERTQIATSSEARFKSIFEQAPLAFCILTGPKLIIEFANELMLKLWRKPASVIGRAYAKVRSEPEAAEFIDLLEGVYTTGVPFTGNEVKAYTAKGNTREWGYFNFTYQPIRTDGNITGILAIVADVTDNVLAREGTLRINDQLGLAVDAANLGIWHIHPETKALLYNPKLAEIFGYEGKKPMTYDQAIGQVTDECRPVILHKIEEAIKTGGSYDITYQQRRFKDNALIWLRSSGKISADEAGNYTIFSGVVMDITEREKQDMLLQTLNEEMAATNEEITVSNEELSQSREELQKLLAELADSETKTRNIVEGAPFPIGVYTGREMRIMFANRSILEVWGKGSDVIGKLYADILPELDNQEVFNQLDGVYTTGIPFEARNQRIDLIVDGEPRTYYFNYNFTPLHNEAGEVYGVMNTAADVTDAVMARQQVEQASDAVFALNEELAAINEELTAANEEQNTINRVLAEVNEKYRHSQDELELAINAASLATFDLNPETGRFVGNDLLKSWFGLLPEDEIELHKATDVIADADRERVIAAIQHALTFESGGDFDTYYVISNPLNPVPRIVRAKGKTLFNEQMQATRLSGVLQDVTEQQRDEQRKNDFIGMVSHELKTPLTSLTAIVQVLNAKLRTSEDNFIASALDKASIQVKKMSTMINGFLNISRLESGKIQMDKKTFNLEDLIGNIISEAQLISTGHQIILTPCDPTPVYADPDKIGSVISNLLSNAVKYSPKGTQIIIQCQTKTNEVEVSIRDEGIGIKPEDMVHLFDRYYRVNNPNYSHISGFGIGLYLSSEIILQHEGKIWVESESGKGSTFYFSIPF